VFGLYYDASRRGPLEVVTTDPKTENPVLQQLMVHLCNMYLNNDRSFTMLYYSNNHL
jgi:hypothetical protein